MQFNLRCLYSGGSMVTRFFAVCMLACLALPGITLAAPPVAKERLLVIHAVEEDARREQEATALSSVHDAMLELLTDRGYRVVDRQAAEQASLQIAATHEIDPLLNKAAAYGLKFLAEYTIYFRTSTTVKDPDKGIGALVRVSAKVVDNTSAQVITSKAAEASSTGHTTEDAVVKAARTAAKKTTELLVVGLDSYLAQSGNGGRTFIMVFEGRDSQITTRLVPLLERNPSIAAVKEVEAGGGKTTLEIISRIRRDQLDRELLNAVEPLGWRLQKIRSEGNRSTWKIR